MTNGQSVPPPAAGRLSTEVRAAIQAELRDVYAAIEAMFAALNYRQPGEVPRCGRPTKSGHSCAAARMREPPEIERPAAVVAEYRDYLPPACRQHATGDEIATHDWICALTQQCIDDHRRAISLAQRVHCWAWPITEEHGRQQQQIANCADPQQAGEMALRLLWDWQDGHCAICAGPAQDLDHCHQTGMVRGYLCHCCNTGEGFSNGNPASVFARYAQRNPASILGLEIRYFSPFTGWAEPGPPPPPIDGNHPSYLVARLLGEVTGTA